MTESPFFFSNAGEKLFGVLHEPEESTSNGSGFVFCHAFAEEKLWAHRFFVNCARRLSRSGYTVLRFDYRGYGDSDGAFENSTIDTQISDVLMAINELNAKCSGLRAVRLLGLRYGATIACLAAERGADCTELVLLDPVLDMRGYIQDALRSHLTTQMILHGKIVMNRDQMVEVIKTGEFINIDGYDIGRAFYETAERIDILSTPKTFKGNCLVVEIARKEKPISEKLQAFSGTFQNAVCRQAIEEPFWKESKVFVQDSLAIEEVVTDWLKGVA